MSEEAPSLDLSALDFRPAWAKDTSPAPLPVFREERPERRERPDHRGPRPEKREGFQRGGPQRGGPRRETKGGFRGPKDQGRFERPPRDEPPEPPINPFPWLRIAFSATEPAVETVAKQIRQTGKTFSLFDIARILLRNPASYTIDLSAAPKAEEGPFYVVSTDGSTWLSKDAAARHILRKRFDEFYRAETVQIEPPKGNFPVVAVCGMSGTLIGPPNHHDYERRLRELHRERFPHMDFEQFRSRLKMDRDPEVVEKWRASASQAVEYYPREGENAEKLADLAAVERHFTAQHAPVLIKFVGVARVPGDPKTTAVEQVIAPLLNFAREEEERFPLRLAQSLSRSLSSAGLRFHKSTNRTTFVSASRPRHLNIDDVAVSDSIKKIIELIRGKKSIRRRQLLDLLAPITSEASAPAESPTPSPSAAPTNAAESVSTSASDETPTASHAPESVGTETAPAAPTSDTPSQAEPSPEPAVTVVRMRSPEEAAREAVVQDLLWLTHEGYVIEHADSRLESVPLPKTPPKPPAPAQNSLSSAAPQEPVEEAITDPVSES